MGFTQRKHWRVRKEQETPVRLGYSEMELEHKYRYKNGKKLK